VWTDHEGDVDRAEAPDLLAAEVTTFFRSLRRRDRRLGPCRLSVDSW
jgi:hypothetical protein